VHVEKSPISISGMVPCSTDKPDSSQKVIKITNCKSGSSYPDILIIDPV
jgi:hypothetical protein